MIYDSDFFSVLPCDRALFFLIYCFILPKNKGQKVKHGDYFSVLSGIYKSYIFDKLYFETDNRKVWNIAGIITSIFINIVWTEN